MPSSTLTRKAVPSSLRLKTVLAVFTGLLLLAMSAMMYGLVQRIFGRIEPATRSNLEWITVRGARELANGVDVALAAKDRTLLNQALKDFRHNGNVMGIIVQDVDGKAVLVDGTLPEEPDQLFKGPEGIVRSGEGFFVAWAHAAIEGVDLGRIALVISTAQLEEGARLRRFMVLVSVLGALAAMIIAMAFVHFYVGPLLSLIDGAMAALKEWATTLEGRIGERTAALTTANSKLEASMTELNRAQKELLEASRESGMAEVATSVLHNVGNVLNSVSVSAEVIGERFRKSATRGLGDVVLMLKGHESDLAHFVTNDPKGRHLPAYLAKLDQVVTSERDEVGRQVESLRKNIDHIKVVISIQQKHATRSSMMEIFSLAELVDDAVNFSFGTHHPQIEVVRDMNPMDDLELDRHSVFHILMNLLQNARNAVQDNEGTKRITIRATRHGNDRLLLEVNDNGCGIATENLNRIFNHGFTTRKQGHGFGLHSAANAATAMRGSLSVSSLGLTKGATFALELPMTSRGGGDDQTKPRDGVVSGQADP